MSQTTYKINLVGCGNNGKTSFLEKFDGLRKPTNGDGELKTISFETTNNDKIIFDVFTDNSFDKTSKFDGIILMFNLNDKKSFEGAVKIYNDVKINKDNKVILCGNKADLDKIISTKEINEVCEVPTIYVEMSVKTGKNIEMPFLHLARMLENNDEFYFF